MRAGTGTSWAGGRSLFEDLACLAPQFVEAVLAGPGSRLVRGHDDPPDPGVVVERLERDDHLDRGAVRVRDDALVPREIVRVHLGHDERARRVHAPRRTVVDDHGPLAHRLGREIEARIASAEKMAMSIPAKLAAVASRQTTVPPANGTRVRDVGHIQRAEFAHREPTLVERPDHLGADHARRTHDRNVPAACVTRALHPESCNLT